MYDGTLHQNFIEDIEFSETLEEAEGILKAYKLIKKFDEGTSYYVMTERAIGLVGNPADESFYNSSKKGKLFKRQRDLIKQWWLLQEWHWYEAGDGIEKFDVIAVAIRNNCIILKRDDYVGEDDSPFDILNSGEWS